MGTSERQQAWTRYWQSGALHSCVGSYEGNYGGAVAAFWRARFAGVSADMRVLDLCTGNGPLPALLLEHFGDAPAPAIDAVDFAEPRPAWRAASRVRFHPRVAIERLPFADGTFDRAVSQYGIEYADRDAAAAEVARVLKPGGEAAFVCHHADSWLATVAADEAAHAAWLLGGGVLDATAAVFDAVARGGPQAAVSDPRFDAQMRGLAERVRTARVPDALHAGGETIGQLVELAATRGAPAARAALTQWRARLTDARLRSAELVEHALDRAAVDALVAALGRDADVGELHEGDYLLGWTIVSR